MDSKLKNAIAELRVLITNLIKNKISDNTK